MKKRKSRHRRPVRFLRKLVYQTLLDRGRAKTTLFVFGCQRSGTTVFTQLFQHDLASKVYGEKGLSRNEGDERDRRFRLLPPADIRRRTAGERASLLVSKPLVESQNARQILDALPESRGVWMVRAFRDVAYSSQRRFSRETAMRNMRAIVTSDAETSFASENVSDDVRKVVERYFSEDMSGDDAQILFWFVRNQLYFDQVLENHERVLLCAYEHLVADPEHVMRRVYRFLGRDYPGAAMTAGVHNKSVDRNIKLDATPALVELCESLQGKLFSLAKG
ncbi:MAG: sulfotransferase [Pseudomonadota bacterium]